MPKGILLLSCQPVNLAPEWPLGHVDSAGNDNRAEDARKTEKTKTGTSLDATIMMVFNLLIWAAGTKAKEGILRL